MGRGFQLVAFLLFTGFLLEAQQTQLDQGLVLSQKGDHQGASKIFQELLAINPGDLQAKLELSREKMYLEEWAESIRLCKELLEQKKDSVIRRRSYVTYGTALDASGDKKAAVRAYKKGISEYPTYYLLPFNLGVTYYKMNKKEDALEQFSSSAQLNPAHASSAYYLATLMEEEKNRIASALALMRFLILEQEGARTLKALSSLQQKLAGNVSKTGENQINIVVDPGQMDKKSENNFASVDLFLSLSVATQLGKEGGKQTKAEKLFSEINTLCSSLESNRSGQKGFFWRFYAPFFIELLKNGHAETLSYIYLSYQADPDNDVIQWVADNKEKTEAFFIWESNYQWPK